MEDGDREVQAAGGVVSRRPPDGVVEVLVVHRPKYDDWTFPKGKLEPGERHEDAAVREVAEETGLRCTLGPELPSTRYDDRHGRPKVVRYWSMRLASGTFAPNDEVDEIRWLTPDSAAGLLTHDRDREVLAAFGTLG